MNKAPLNKSINLDRCPGTLSKGYTSYSTTCLKKVFGNKKINQENIDIQNQMTQILLAGKSHMQSQKRILKSLTKIMGWMGYNVKLEVDQSQILYTQPVNTSTVDQTNIIE